MKCIEEWARVACLGVSFALLAPSVQANNNDWLRRQQDQQRQDQWRRVQQDRDRQAAVERQRKDDWDRQQRQMQRERDARATREKQGTGAGVSPTVRQQPGVAENRGARATPPGGGSPRAQDNVSYVNGLVKRPISAGELRRGFTGKFTGDGRALVKIEGRVRAFPAARLGIMPKATASSHNALLAHQQPVPIALGTAVRDLLSNPDKPPGLARKLQKDRAAEVAGMFSHLGTPSSMVFGGATYAAERGARSNMVLLNTSRASAVSLQNHVLAYARELGGGKALTQVHRDGKPGERLYYVHGDDGTMVNVRNVSTSDVSRWTIDVKNFAAVEEAAKAGEGTHFELKFR